MSDLPFPDEDFLDDIGLTSAGRTVPASDEGVRTPVSAEIDPLIVSVYAREARRQLRDKLSVGWVIEAWVLTESDAGEWLGTCPVPYKTLRDAITCVRSGERIVNVVTGRVVLEA